MRDNNVSRNQRRMMFCRAFVFVTIFYFTTGDALTKKNDKRLGINSNFQACLDSFDVRKDKIIKTQDSQRMGAKYLTEMDVDSRQECLKSCCSTDRCDVFIFEEKKPGSCYLFQCGPIQDFKCKFTGHANYTSAVRTNYDVPGNSRSHGDLQSISQQEHELKSLRKLGDVAPAEYSFTEAPVKATVTQTPKLLLTTSVPVKPGCSRNQYECRSSGDCIAIYNVCDGIPQCADGSDEAAELVCPTEKPTIPPAMVMQGPIQPPYPPNIAKYQQMIDSRKAYSKSWDFPNLARQTSSQQQNLLYPAAQQMEVPQLRKNFGLPGYQWDYQPIYEQNKELYNPPNTFREANNMNPYEQGQGHIFNHKGPGVVEENQAESGSSYSEPKRPYASHFLSPNRGVWQEGQAQPIPPITSVTPNFQRKEINEAPKQTKSTTAPPCDTSNEHVESSVVRTENEEQKQERTKLHEKHSDESVEKPGGSTLQSEPVKHRSRERTTNELKDRKSVIVIEDHPRDHERSILISEHLQRTTELEVLRPKGAVISLALGLTATAITAALIACRLRVVRRRGRRGHGPYAHDADYLVNGMYL